MSSAREQAREAVLKVPLIAGTYASADTIGDVWEPMTLRFADAVSDVWEPLLKAAHKALIDASCMIPVLHPMYAEILTTQRKIQEALGDNG